MYLNSLIGLNKLIKSNAYYKLATPESKKKLIDRCNFICHCIIQGNYHKKGIIKDFKVINIHSDNIRFILGEHYYIKILNLLFDLDIVRPDGNHYIVGETSKAYYFTEYAQSFDIGAVGVLSKTLGKRLVKYRKRKLINHLKHPVHAKQIRNLCELRFNGKQVSKTWDSKDPIAQEIFYGSTFSNLVRFNGYTSTDDFIIDHSFYYYPSKFGRTYHYFSNIPKLYRYQLEHISGESIIEIDMNQAQPLFLALSYEEFRYVSRRDVKQKEEQQELGYLYELNKQFMSDNKYNVSFSYDLIEKHDKTAVSTLHYTDDVCEELGMSEVLHDCLTKDFYIEVRDHVYTMGDDRLIKKYGKMSRKDIKKEIVSNGLYAKNEHSQNDIFKVMSSKYPEFMEFVRLFKIKFNHESLPQMAQSRESTIFIDGLFNRIDDEFAVTVHDALLCKLSEADEFEAILISLMQQNYPFVEPSLFENVFSREEYKPNK